MPPDEIIAKGLAGINEWVIEQGREWAKSERERLGIDESIFALVLPDARGNLIERSPLARYPKDMRAAVLAEMEAAGKKKPVAPQSDSVVKTKPVGSEPMPPDPLLDLLDGKPAKTPTEEILDILGVTNTPPPKPVAPEPKPDPIPGVPAGQERWYLHLKEQEDRASTAHLTLPTGAVNRYREYDRPDDATKVLKKAIAEDGVRLPLWISTDGEQALLVEGNHRLAVAKDLGIEELPIRVTYNKEVLRNEGRDPAPLTGPLKEWVQAHLEELKRGELS